MPCCLGAAITVTSWNWHDASSSKCLTAVSVLTAGSKPLCAGFDFIKSLDTGWVWGHVNHEQTLVLVCI
jgi:hypothetical protein